MDAWKLERCIQIVLLIGVSFTTAKSLEQKSLKFNTDLPAFSAGINADKNVTDGVTVVFDKVITDNLGDYNSGFGFFTCPCDGVYMFTVSVRSLNGLTSQVAVHKNMDPPFLSVKTYTDTAATSGTYSAMGVIFCEAQSSVSSFSVGNGFLTGDSIFSGYLLDAQDEPCIVQYPTDD